MKWNRLIAAVAGTLLFAGCVKDDDPGPSTGLPFACTNLVVVQDSTVHFALPTAFTPNGDGKNDLIRPLINLPVAPDFTFAIYRLDGQQVFQTSTISQGWNGTDTSGTVLTDTLYRVTFRLTRPGNQILDTCSYLYVLPSGNNCVHLGDIDPGKLYFEDMFENTTLTPQYVTAETFCP